MLRSGFMAKARPARANARRVDAVTTRESRPLPAWIPPAVLAALTFAVYANSIGNGFIGDDQYQLLRNPAVKDIAAIPRLFGAGVWSFLGVTANYYRPAPFVIYNLIYQLAGFQAWAFHLAMVLLHVANTLLLFALLRRIASVRIAVDATALFAIHPVHTEAVDWVASLPDLSLTTLALAGVLSFARQVGKPRPLQVAIHCIIYFFALLTKETGVALAALYFCFGFFVLQRRWSELQTNLKLYAAMACTFAVYLAMRLSALGSFAPRKHDFFHLAPFEFVLSATVTAAQYLRVLTLPLGLNYFHVFHPTQTVTLAFLASAAVLTGVAILFARSSVPLVSYGIFWIAATIAPALDLTAVGQNVFTERYLYLPSVAFCWIAAWAWRGYSSKYRRWATAAAVALLAFFALMTIERNRDWHDDFTMLLTTERQSPDSGWVHDTLAGEFVNRSEFARALDEERLAVRYDPGMALYRKKLGYILMGGAPRGAIAEFQAADRLDPGVAANHYDLGAAYEAAGDLSHAAEEYKRALELQPQYMEARQAYERVARLPR